MARRKFSALMERSKKKSILRRIFSGSLSNKAFSFLIPLFLFFPAQLYPFLVDRTVALIEDRVLTYREVERRYIVSRLADGFKVNLYKNEMDSQEFKIARDYTVKTVLVRMYLDRIALKSFLSKEEVDNVFNSLRKYFKDPNQFDKFQKFYEIDINEIKYIIGDKLTTDQFFSKSFGEASSINDAQVFEYYKREKENKFFGKSFEELKEYIRKYLQNQKIKRSSDEWLRGQMKKIKIHLIG